MPRIPDEVLDRLKHEIPLVTLAERSGVELKRMGHELMGRCPFPPHEDSTPSLAINEEKNVFQCFGCGAAGTPIDWVMREKGLDFRQAVEVLLRDFYPSEADEVLGASRQRVRRSSPPVLPSPFEPEASDQALLDQYANLCHLIFKESEAPQEYARKRGLDSSELVSHFQLGYADRSLGLRLPEKATKTGAAIRARLQKLGILRESGHELMVGSVVIPIRDEAGNVRNLYGRKTRDDLRPGTPDHLYLPGHRDVVFNPEALKASSEVILCESLIDALTFWRWGFRNVTTAYGVNGFTDEILEAMKAHGTEKVLIAFDRDDAGESGARKVGEKLMAAGIECLRILFPKGMDVNEVALKMQPADKTLGLFLRSAEWMGNGHKPGGGVALERAASYFYEARLEAPLSAARATSPVSASASAAPARSSDASASPAEATEEKTARAAEEGISLQAAREAASPNIVASFAQVEAPSGAATKSVGVGAIASVSSPAPPSPLATIPGLLKLTDDEAELLFEDRRYRALGLRKCGAYGSLRINLKAEREGILFEAPAPIAGWHMDNLDLCVHRARQAFERVASHELGVKEELIRFDLGKIVKLLEAVQEQRLAEASVPKVKLVKLSEKETEEAIAFWKSADLFTRIADDYTKCGLVGELTNKIATYISSTSRLLDRPLAIIIQSSSAAGKSTLMEKTLAFVPEEMKEKYTAVSGKSLFYLDENTVLSHKILAIVEEEGAEKATYPLKILNSEGELVMASTGKDPHTGKLVTKIYRVEGPVMIILTTTSVEIDPELENRCLRLTVDESREQTRAIHELQRMRMTHEGHLLQAEREQIQKLHQNAHRLLRRLHVHNPYARHLTFVSDQTRTRRDHDKYLSLIETIALMHQFQRPVYRLEVSGTFQDYVDVTIEDLELAGRLVGEIVGQLLHDLPPQTRVFLRILDEIVTKLCEESGVERSELRFTRRQIRELTGWHETQIRVHMARLIDLEYVLVHRGSRGHSFAYELLYAGQGQDGKPFVLGLVDVEKLRQEEAAGTAALASETPAEPVAPSAETSERTETPSTTSGSRGEDRGVAGSLRPHCGPIAGGMRGQVSGPGPAPEVASDDSEPKPVENALIPPARRTQSYTLKPVVPAQDDGNGNGDRLLLRINLLRRPAVTLARSASAH
jgi:DNA primase catalytic core